MRTPFSLSLLLLASSGLVGCAGGGARDSGLLDQDYDGYTVADGDCDDGNGAINPLATDVVGDGIDQNCDGIDGLDGDGDGWASELSGGDDCDEQADLDGDGYSTCDGDCDDSDASLELADSDRDGCTTC